VNSRTHRVLIAVALAVLGVAAVAAWVVESEPDWYLRARYPLEYEHILRVHGANHDLDPALLAAVVYVESRFDPNAESEAGALGLMQLLPETAKGIALQTGGHRFVVADLRDPELNVRYGSWYLDHLVGRYGSKELALAAYHAGQGNVDEWRRTGAGIAFSETRSYISDVIELERIYRRVYSGELGSP
jgi:peptidoglycan lytic transglycosylase